MSVTSMDADQDRLTLTLVAEFDAPIERVWRLWEDPRQLERWWGPPSYPATFEKHNLAPDGDASYYMTGPDGEKYRGWWRITAVNPPTSLEFVDGFADDAGAPMDDMPLTTTRVQLSQQGASTRMELRTEFASREDMDQLMEMGQEEGLREAVGQIDSLLVG